MEWANLYGADRQPSAADMAAYVASPLWEEINGFLQENYGVEPRYSYSCCPAQPGWNVKYQKGGRSLCTLYPMSGFFIALIVIGTKEQTEAELLMPTCGGYTRELFFRTPFSAGGQWLMLAVTDEHTLDDAKRLIQVRRKPKAKV